MKRLSCSIFALLALALTATAASFPYITLNKHTNQLSDNGTALTFNGAALGISTNLTDSGTNVLAQGGVIASVLVATNGVYFGANTNGWAEMSPISDSEGGTVFGSKSIDPLNSSSVLFAVNYLTNFWGYQSIISSLFAGPYGPDVMSLATNNASLGFWGDSAGYHTVASGTADGYFVGDNSGAYSTFKDTSQIYFFGHNSGNTLGATNSLELYGFGHDALKSANVNGTGIYAIGEEAMSGANLTFVTSSFALGYQPFKNASLFNNYQIFGFGGQPLFQASLTNNAGVYAIGGLQSAVLNDSIDVVSIGQTAGNSISGSYTNVVLIGDGATIGATGKDEVHFGPTMTIYGNRSVWTNGLTAGVGAQVADGVTNVINVGTSAGSIPVSGSGELYSIGDYAFQGSAAQSLFDSYFIGSYAGYQAAYTNSSYIFLFGDSTGQRVSFTSAQDIYGLGDGVFGSAVFTSVSDAFAIGDAAFSSAIINTANDLFAIGNGAGANANIDGSSWADDFYFFGNNAGSSLTAVATDDLYLIGYQAGQGLSSSNSFYIYSLGGLKSATLTDTHDLVTIGQTAGNNISGSYTNVVLIGDGATLGATGENQVILGPGMDLVAPTLQTTAATIGSMAVVRTNITHAGTITLDFAATNRYATLSLTGNVTFATANLAAGKWFNVIVTMTSTNDTPTFPAWKWLGGAPSTLTGNQIGVLSLYPTSTTDATTLAAYTETQ